MFKNNQQFCMDTAMDIGMEIGIQFRKKIIKVETIYGGRNLK